MSEAITDNLDLLLCINNIHETQPCRMYLIQLKEPVFLKSEEAGFFCPLINNDKRIMNICVIDLIKIWGSGFGSLLMMQKQ